MAFGETAGTRREENILVSPELVVEDKQDAFFSFFLLALFQ